MAGSIVVSSAVKKFIKKAAGEAKFNCASGVLDNIEGAVEQILKDAVRRAKENGRKTVQPQDI